MVSLTDEEYVDLLDYIKALKLKEDSLRYEVVLQVLEILGTTDIDKLKEVYGPIEYKKGYRIVGTHLRLRSGKIISTERMEKIKSKP